MLGECKKEDKKGHSHAIREMLALPLITEQSSCDAKLKHEEREQGTRSEASVPYMVYKSSGKGGLLWGVPS